MKSYKKGRANNNIAIKKRMTNWIEPPPIKETNVYLAIKQALNEEFSNDIHTALLLSQLNDSSIIALLDKMNELEQKINTLTGA